MPLDALAAYPSSNENDSVEPNDEEMPIANLNSDSGQEELPSNEKPTPKKQLLFRNFTEKANELYKACSNDSKMLQMAYNCLSSLVAICRTENDAETVNDQFQAVLCRNEITSAVNKSLSINDQPIPAMKTRSGRPPTERKRSCVERMKFPIRKKKQRVVVVSARKRVATSIISAITYCNMEDL